MMTEFGKEPPTIYEILRLHNHTLTRPHSIHEAGLCLQSVISLVR